MRTEIRVQIEDESFSEQTTNDLMILVIYDTALVKSKNEGEQGYYWKEAGNRPWYVPAKYGLSFDARPALGQRGSDSGIFAQVIAYTDEYMYQTIWFDCIRDLPEAIKRLKRKFPKKDFGEQIDYIIDFPLRRNDLKPGSTIVKPRPPKVKKAAGKMAPEYVDTTP